MVFTVKHKDLKAGVPLVVGIAILLLFLLWSFFPSMMAPFHPKEMFPPWARPSSVHILGTNDMGYDIFSELVYATATTLLTGVAASLISIFAGTAIGALAGYLEAWKAALINLLIDVFLLIPMLPICIVLASFLGPGTRRIIITISLLGWCSTAKAVRSKTKQLKHADFIESLQILGIPKIKIIFRHIIPNLWDVILARYIISVANCIMLEATISFVGLGDITNVTWGGMINFAFRRGGFTRGTLNWYIPPGVCIILCVQAFYCINMYLESRNKAVSGEGQVYLD